MIFSKIIRTSLSKYLILTLHRVSDPEIGFLAGNESLKFSPSELHTLIRTLRESGYTFISIDDFYHQVFLGEKASSAKNVILTFDDGYRDNFTIAYPILSELAVPFVVYLATGIISRQSIMWWHGLETLIARSDSLSLPYDINLTTLSLAQKNAAFFYVRKILMGSSLDKYKSITDAISNTLEVHERQSLSNLSMSWADISELSKDPLVTIGAHTVSHPVLSNLSYTDIKDEVVNSRSAIERVISKSVDHFAYPYGGRHETNAFVANVVKKCGFKTAVTTCYGSVYSLRQSNQHLLPRIPLTNGFDIRKVPYNESKQVLKNFIRRIFLRY